MIGIFDSGVGGMTVAHAIEQALPERRLVYLGDLARTPYGSKSPETIRGYAEENIAFLRRKGAKIIVIACNSAASVAADEMRRRFAMPIFDVIAPAVARIARLPLPNNGRRRVGVIGTRATVQSAVYREKIRKVCGEAEVFSQACPLLVPLVEEGWLNKRETKMILRRYLTPLQRHQVDSLVLGCTHYPLLGELIQARMGRRVRVIDSSRELAAGLKGYLAENQEVAQTLAVAGDNCYYVTDVTPAALDTARKIFGRDIELKRVRLGE